MRHFIAFIGILLMSATAWAKPIDIKTYGQEADTLIAKMEAYYPGLCKRDEYTVVDNETIRLYVCEEVNSETLKMTHDRLRGNYPANRQLKLDSLINKLKSLGLTDDEIGLII